MTFGGNYADKHIFLLLWVCSSVQITERVFLLIIIIYFKSAKVQVLLGEYKL